MSENTGRGPVPGPLRELLNIDVAPYIQEKPGGVHRATGRAYPPIPYLGWQAVCRILDAATSGRWHTAVKVADGGVAVHVALTVDTPAGPVTRESIAQVVSSQLENVPPLEMAERAAFVRAATQFGVQIPKAITEEREAKVAAIIGRKPGAVASGDAAASAGSDGERRCVCGSPLTGRFDTCYACYEFPNRQPGVCVCCGEPAAPNFARCWECKQRNAPTQERFANAGKAAATAPPATAAEPPSAPLPEPIRQRIESCRTAADFNALSSDAAASGWSRQEWAQPARQALFQAATRQGLTYTNERGFHQTGEQANPAPAPAPVAVDDADDDLF